MFCQFARPMVVVVVVGLTLACAARPRQRPLQTTRISDSLQQVRKQLEGSWDLVALELHPSGLPAVQVGARGVLVYDAYGNLEMNGVVVDPAYAKMGGVLSLKGRAVIDEPNKQIRFLDVLGNAADMAREVVPERIRRYEFDGNVLRLTSVDTSGQPTAVATWKKR